jgi:hypothetical protein
MPEQISKRVYRRENEIKAALIRSDFNLVSAAEFLGMTLKALHERLQRTRNGVFSQLKLEQRNSKPCFSDKAIEELLVSSPNVDIEVYRKVRRDLKKQDSDLVGNRRAQIEKAIAQACDVAPQDAFAKLNSFWVLRRIGQIFNLELCRRDQKYWEAARKQRRRLRRRHEAVAIPPGGGGRD